MAPEWLDLVLKRPWVAHKTEYNYIHVNRHFFSFSAQWTNIDLFLWRLIAQPLLHLVPPSLVAADLPSSPHCCKASRPHDGASTLELSWDLSSLSLFPPPKHNLSLFFFFCINIPCCAVVFCVNRNSFKAFRCWNCLYLPPGKGSCSKCFSITLSWEKKKWLMTNWYYRKMSVYVGNYGDNFVYCISPSKRYILLYH